MSRTEEGRPLRRRLFPSPALVVAMIALLAATAGTALANHGGKHGPAGIVNSLDVGDGTLTGIDIKDHSLTPKDFRGSVRGPRGRTGARGPQGSQGPQGNPGANGQNGGAGPPGFSVLNYVTSNAIASPNNGAAAGGTLLAPAGSFRSEAVRARRRTHRSSTKADPTRPATAGAHSSSTRPAAARRRPSRCTSSARRLPA